jgi:hypothetical protein
MLTDFLGNVMEVGDLILYSPRGGVNGELVIAKFEEIKETRTDLYGWLEDGTWGKLSEVKIGHKYGVLPVKATSTYRTKGARKVYLQNLHNAMLYKKGKQDGAEEV